MTNKQVWRGRKILTFYLSRYHRIEFKNKNVHKFPLFFFIFFFILLVHFNRSRYVKTQETDGVSRIPKLTGSEDFINWRRRVKVFLQKRDVVLLGLSEKSEEGTGAQQRRWFKSMIKAKSAIFLNLTGGTLVQVSEIIDRNDRTTKDLWETLDQTYHTSKNQMVINLQQELESLILESDEKCDKHVETFNKIVGKLASYKNPI